MGVWSERSATIEGDLYLAEQIDGLAAQVGGNNATILSEQVARVQGDKALASTLTRLSTNVGGNTADIEDLRLVVNDPESGLSAKYNQLQSVTNTISDEYKKKADIVFSNSQPTADKRNARTLWIDTCLLYTSPSPRD